MTRWATLFFKSVLPTAVLLSSSVQAAPPRSEGSIEAYWDGNQLDKFCNPQADNPKLRDYQMICLGYSIGVLDGVRVYEEALNRNPMVCTNSVITSKQIREVVTKYLRGNPADLHLSASVLVIKALSEAFPCDAK